MITRPRFSTVTSETLAAGWLSILEKLHVRLLEDIYREGIEVHEISWSNDYI